MLDDGDSEERHGMLMPKASWGWGILRADADPGRTAEYIAAA